MPGLIPLIKKTRPTLPIIYRSHIEIRSDLVHQPGSAQEEVWQYLWKDIQLADLFISKYFICLSSWPYDFFSRLAFAASNDPVFFISIFCMFLESAFNFLLACVTNNRVVKI